jgi:hypothetical protein
LRIHFFLLLLAINCQAQEFPRGEFILHARLHSGLISNFQGNTPDIFTGGIEAAPQFTLLPNRLRGGMVADLFYAGKKWQAAVGPTVSIKLINFGLKNFGSGGNVHLSLDHRWGTGRQRLAGGGIHADVLNLLVLGITTHRDYNLNNWWMQASFGIRLSKVKQPPHP